MNTFINKYDEKYENLSQMLIYKIHHPVKFAYHPVCKFNGVLLNIITNLHDKGVIFERFLYNTNTTNLYHYRITYDCKILALIHPPRIIKKIKKTKKEKELHVNFRKMSNQFIEFTEICKKENDMTKRKKMISQLLEETNNIIKKYC
jgi:hypothetical protein